MLRRHAQLLAEAGIDTLIFDTTNARSYPDVYLTLCEVFREIRQAGGRTPQIVFHGQYQGRGNGRGDLPNTL